MAFQRYMTSDAAATRAALGPFAALMGGSWSAMEAEFNPNDPVYINGPIWSEPGVGLAFGVSQVVKIGGAGENTTTTVHHEPAREH